MCSINLSKADKGALLIAVLMKSSSPAIRIVQLKTSVIYDPYVCVFNPHLPLIYTLHFQFFVTARPNIKHNDCLYVESNTSIAFGI